MGQLGHFGQMGQWVTPREAGAMKGERVFSILGAAL
jgi:hypothetical protein